MSRLLAVSVLASFASAQDPADEVCHSASDTECHEESAETCRQHQGDGWYINGTCASAGYPHCFVADILSYWENWYTDASCPEPPQTRGTCNNPSARPDSRPCPAPPPAPTTTVPPCGEACMTCQHTCDEGICSARIGGALTSCSCSDSDSYCVGHCHDACEDHGKSLEECTNKCDGILQLDRSRSCYYGCAKFYGVEPSFRLKFDCDPHENQCVESAGGSYETIGWCKNSCRYSFLV